MKKQNKKNKYFLSKKQIKLLNKLSIVSVVIIFVASLMWYFKLDLYFTDKYLWYIELGNKQYNIFHNDGDGASRVLKYADKAIHLDAERLDAYKLKAELYYVLNLFDKSEEELSKLKDTNESSFYYMGMGDIKRKQNMLNESLYYHHKSIEEDNFSVDNYIAIGLTYLKMNDIKNSFKYLNHSKTLVEQLYPHQQSERQHIFRVHRRGSFMYDNKLAVIHTGMGFIYQKQGHYQKAEEEFRIARSIDMDYADFYFSKLNS